MDTEAVKEVKRESQITSALARLHQTIDELNAVVIRHEDSLSGILRDDETEKQLIGNATEQEVLVPIAKVLDSFRGRLKIIIDRFDSIQRRLEL